MIPGSVATLVVCSNTASSMLVQQQPAGIDAGRDLHAPLVGTGDLPERIIDLFADCRSHI